MTPVWEILAIIALMFMGITVAALLFVHSLAKIKSRNEIQKKKIDVMDKHFDDILWIECPYCKTKYKANQLQCPNCKAATKAIILPEMPEKA